MLISVGYSACHWCHVMEHESFENEEVARLMNDNFVCIKVDREERPDIDHYYLEAVQLIAGTGGWPLNCFTLPNGKPLFGGTYFPTEQWIHLLMNLSGGFKNEPEKFYQAAESVHGGITKLAEYIGAISPVLNNENTHSAEDNSFLKMHVEKMVSTFDRVNGGSLHVPKFPMPADYEFLLSYSHWLNNADKYQELCKEITEHLYRTLDKMAMGGIFDQVGGGFSRYSTDALWKAPHFEKMLYDNGQLMSLYAHVWQCKSVPLYKEVVYGIHHFISAELTSPEGGFYCALDADSDGKEGAYYVWSNEEIHQLLGKEFPLFANYFSIADGEEWEDGKFILYRNTDDGQFCKKHKLPEHDFPLMKNRWTKLLYSARKNRKPPALDDKILASWNGIMLKGYLDAYKAFGDKVFLQAAIANGSFLHQKLTAADGALLRSYKNGKAKISAFLDDYALVADAFFNLYQCTFDEQWLNRSLQIAEYAIRYFYDSGSKLFLYSAARKSDSLTELVVMPKNIETSDNVIPSSNSVMAHLLFGLGHTLCRADFIKIAVDMMLTVKERALTFQGHSNWLSLLLLSQGPFYEIVIAGENAIPFMNEMNAHYFPNKIIAGAEKVSDMELLKEKFVANETLIYVCQDKVCSAPAHSPEQVLKSILKYT